MSGRRSAWMKRCATLRKPMPIRSKRITRRWYGRSHVGGCRRRREPAESRVARPSPSAPEYTRVQQHFEMAGIVCCQGSIERHRLKHAQLVRARIVVNDTALAGIEVPGLRCQVERVEPEVPFPAREEVGRRRHSREV